MINHYRALLGRRNSPYHRLDSPETDPPLIGLVRLFTAYIRQGLAIIIQHRRLDLSNRTFHSRKQPLGRVNAVHP